MKALPSQFDDRRLTSAVATPTCSSCCCCCCCLATSIAASSLLAQRIGREGEKKQIPGRYLLTILATLFVPTVGVLVYLGFWTVNSLLRTCTERSYGVSSRFGPDSYTICTNPGAATVIPLLIIVPILVLWYLYSKVHIQRPFKRAILVTTLIVIAFTAEFFGGAMLILTGVGGIVYLILVPIIIGWISVWYHGHIGKRADDFIPVPSAKLAYPPIEQSPSEQNEEPSTPEQPPQSGPTTPSSQ